VNGADIYPAAGMLVMALEAAHRMSDSISDIEGYHFKDVSIKRPLVFPAADDGLEVQVFFRPGKERMGSFLNWNGFRICVYENEEWSDVCNGSIAIEHKMSASSFTDGRGRDKAFLGYENECRKSIELCKSSMEPRVFYTLLRDCGLRFGPAFRSLTDIRFNERGNSLGTTSLYHWLSTREKDELSSPILHPAALDAFLQLTGLGLSKGGKETPPTMVPTSFRSLWISANIAHAGGTNLEYIDNPHNASVVIHTKSHLRGFRDAQSTIIGQNKKSGAIVLTADFNLTGIADDNAVGIPNSENARKLCYKVEWRPDLRLMDLDSIYSYCSADVKFCSPYANVDREKSQICYYALRKLVGEIKNVDNHLLKQKPHLCKYLRWAERVTKDEAQKYEELSQTQLTELLTKVATNDPQGNLVVAVLKDLKRIINGEVEALEVIFQEGLVDEYYHYTLRDTSAFDDALRYIQVLAHRSPRMRILEVGAGTGSATGRVLQSLTTKDDEKDSKTYLFQQYTFTDISTSFFEAAKGRFSDYSNAIEYRTLDIEREPVDQGFDIAEYDLVIASNVLLRALCHVAIYLLLDRSYMLRLV
jgi:hypothetical protein